MDTVLNQSLRISDLAKLTDCQPVTIRYYEAQGLLPKPMRNDSNYRVYGPPHVERLQFIRHCRSLDMSLEEIHQLLALRDNPANACDQVNALIDQHIDQVQQRIEELYKLQHHLTSLRDSCGESRSVQDCGILQHIAQEIHT